MGMFINLGPQWTQRLLARDLMNAAVRFARLRPMCLKRIATETAQTATNEINILGVILRLSARNKAVSLGRGRGGLS